METSLYQLMGFNSRIHYLLHLSRLFRIDIDIVYEVADFIGGMKEDFNSLVPILEDMAGNDLPLPERIELTNPIAAIA